MRTGVLEGKKRLLFCSLSGSRIAHHAGHPEGTRVFVEECKNGFGFLLRDGMLPCSLDSQEIVTTQEEALLMATYFFRGRFSSGRKNSLPPPHWHRKQRVKAELFVQQRNCTRSEHSQAFCVECGEIPPPPPPTSSHMPGENWGRRNPFFLHSPGEALV